MNDILIYLFNSKKSIFDIFENQRLLLRGFISYFGNRRYNVLE